MSAAVAGQFAQGAIPENEALAHTALPDRDFQVSSSLRTGASVTGIAERLNLLGETLAKHKSHVMHENGGVEPVGTAFGQ